MTLGNIDKDAICKECGVTTTLDSVQHICWQCWIALEDEEILKENASSHLAKNNLTQEEE